jgi:hypothetical protein
MGKCVSKHDKSIPNNSEENKSLHEVQHSIQPGEKHPTHNEEAASTNKIQVLKPYEEKSLYTIQIPTDLRRRKEVSKYIESVIELNLLGQGSNPSLNFEYVIFRELTRSQDIKSVRTFLKAFYSFVKDKTRAILSAMDIGPKDLHNVDMIELIQREGVQVKVRLDPFLDRIWRRAISYTLGYYYLSNFLIGRCIDRVILHEEPTNMKYISKIWSRYNATVATLEENYMVWLKPSEYYLLVEVLIKYIFKRPKKFGGYKIIPLNYIIKVLDKSKRFLRAKKNMRYSSLAVQCSPTDCEHFDSSKSDAPIQDTYTRISQKLSLISIQESVMKEYNLPTHVAEEYYKEYIKYLVLEYYTTAKLIPPDSIEQVWTLHQSFTKDYRDFSFAIYGKMLSHLPVFIHESYTVKNFQMYEKTIELYEFVFKEKPTVMIWPSPEERFSTEYTDMSWISILRVFALLVGYYRNKLIDESTTLEAIIQYIEEGYLLWPDNDASSFEFLKRRKHSFIRSITRTKFWARKPETEAKTTYPGDVQRIIKSEEDAHKSPAQLAPGAVQEVERNSPLSLSESPGSRSGLEDYGLGEHDLIETLPKKEITAAQKNEMKDKLNEEVKEIN